MTAPPVTTLGELLDEGWLPDGGPATAEAGASPPAPALTRGELRDRADRLSAVLRDVGVATGDRVGIHLESSVATMVAVHGVLRAGGVVVPLDPRAPVDHVRGLLADCDVDVLVGGGSARRIADLASARRLRAVVGAGEVPDGTAAISWEDVATAAPAPPVRRSPDDRAYVIYTSGSTGTPKGIVHTHRSGLAYARLAAATYDLRPDDVVATLSPLHFDQSTFSLYAAPLAGAAALMVADALVRFPASLSEVVADHRVTVWYSVPTLLVQVLRRGVIDQRDLSAIRWILYGGEPFPPADLAELMERLPAARVSNVYGPAEVNQCTYHHLDGPPADDEPVPIGVAWDDTEVLVVDEAGEPVTGAAEGEILVCSVTAMEGYWNRPDLTAAAFRDRVGADGRARRWYATGDLGRWRADGELVFVGRADNQVKVRGSRVELEAVDAALAGVAGVDAAVAVVRTGADGARELLALVTAADTDAPPDPADVRRSLARSLPAHAVPSEVRVVDALPRTTTGKVDRRSASALVAGDS